VNALVVALAQAPRMGFQRLKKASGNQPIRGFADQCQSQCDFRRLFFLNRPISLLYQMTGPWTSTGKKFLKRKKS
jgi:hypothetical protein